jgi:hypothetical protein
LLRRGREADERLKQKQEQGELVVVADQRRRRSETFTGETRRAAALDGQTDRQTDRLT